MVMVGKFSDCSTGHRIKTLQKELRSSRNEDPTALLIVPGLDGRNNKESMTLLKFIFFGSVSMDLFKNSLVEDALEEMVLLILENSISIVYSRTAKELCGNALSSCQNLIEYISSDEEQDEVDSQQARKICDFKRMMLESIPNGCILGMSIPLGYDSAQDIECWPLLQSYALDSIICPTGFFTAKYSIVDLNEYLNIAYRAVDEHCVEKVINSLMKSVLKHVNQSIELLEGQISSEGSYTTAGIIAGPLEMLYEFGKHECPDLSTTAADELRRPIVLFGSQTSSIGSAEHLTVNWRDETAANHVHTVLEGCEPATGMRFCRTYFLRCGQTLPVFKYPPSDGTSLAVFEEEDERLLGNVALATESEMADLLNLERTKRLYSKLLLSLRSAVRIAFVTHTDILEAGKYIQNYMEISMKARVSAGPTSTNSSASNYDKVENIPCLSGTTIKCNEVLQVHIDCMNSFGQVISIEDVDDIGGTCWTYIRVSLHGISLSTQNNEIGSISVGDTFLFSVARKIIIEQYVDESVTVANNKHDNQSSATLSFSPSSILDLPLLEDSFCLTHLIPYHRCFPSVGSEEERSREFIVALDNPDLLKTLSLGAHVEVASSSSSRTQSTVTDALVLTDHPLFPLMFSDIKFFSGGFLIFRSDIGGNPMLLSMEHHIAEMWTVDASDCLNISQSRGLIRQPSPWNLGTQDLPDPSVAEGYLLIFRLKLSDDFKTEVTKNSLIDESYGGEIEEMNVHSEGYDEDNNVKGIHRNLERTSINKDGDKDRNSDKEKDVVESMMFNPLKHSLSPLCSPSSGYASDDIIEPEYLAIFVQNGSQLANMMSCALVIWRQTLRSLDIPQHKGEEGKGQGLSHTGRGRNIDGLIPSSILKAYVAAIGTCAMTMNDSSSSSNYFSREETKYDTNRVSSHENIPLPARTILAAGTSLSALPGTGFLSMRCAHALSESIRLQFDAAKLQEYLTQHSQVAQEMRLEHMKSTTLIDKKLLIITGPSGCGLHSISVQMKEQLRIRQDVSNLLIDFVEINFLDAMVMNEKDGILTDAGILNSFETTVTSAFSSPIILQNNCGKNPSVHVTIVTFTTAAQVLLNQSELLNVILECSRRNNPHMNISIGAVVAVIAPKVLLTESATHTDWTLDSPVSPGFLGLEIARGCTKSIVLADVCDMIIIVDVDERPFPSDSVFFKFRQWVKSVNRDAEIIRVNPKRLRLATDDIDTMLKYLGLQNPGFLSARECTRGLRHAPLLSPNPLAVIRNRLKADSSRASLSGLRVLRLHSRSLPQQNFLSASASASASASWSLHSLLSVLQFLFPSASVCVPPGMLSGTWHSDSPLSSSSASTSTSTSSTFSTPSHFKTESRTVKTEKRSFRRLTDLATMKVFCARRFTEEKLKIHNLLAKHAGSPNGSQMSVTQMLRIGLLSVEGLVCVRSSLTEKGNGGSKSLNPSKHFSEYMHIKIEASKGAIIFKECSIESCNTPDSNSGINSLTVQGSLRKPTEAVLMKLFLSCGALQLQPKADLTRDDLTATIIQRVHSRYCEKSIIDNPLPNGWWFNGDIYLDIDGNQREYRPDLELILNQYLILKNKEIVEYNTILQSISHIMQ